MTTTDNLSENDRFCLLLVDYETRQRVKVWGTARVVPATRDLLEHLHDAAYRARPEQVILLTVRAWDENCPQHIPQKVDGAKAASVVRSLRMRIAQLEAENAELHTRVR